MKISLNTLASFLKEIRTILLIFVFLFSGALLFLNWGLLEDVFNYKTIYGNAFQTFNETHFSKKAKAVRVPEVNLVPEAQAIDGQTEIESFGTAQDKLPSTSVETQNEPQAANPPPTTPAQTTQTNNLYIPKIGIRAPLTIAEDSHESYILSLLKKGVVAYPGSTISQDGGTAVILGHSAPPGWPKRNYEWVFSNLNSLETGDEVIVTFNRQNLRYAVTNKFFLKKGQEIPSSGSLNSTIFLVSCWPPGIDRMRIVIRAELI